MRSYRQYCGLAKALDIVGDRWTLLIVRELLIRGPCRYTDLCDGLPGIATNLLADRLYDLEKAGLIRRQTARPPVATALYELTPRGRELESVIAALGRWAGPLMATRSRRDAVRSHWLAWPIQLYLSDRTPDQPPVSIELRTGREPVTVETVDGSVRARPGAASNPNLVLTGPPETLLGVLMGRIELKQARQAGLEDSGDTTVLTRLQRDAPSPHA